MGLYNNAIFVRTKEQMPKVEHWAILKFSTIFIPGDERSRTHPGHGYPASNEPVVNYEAYLTKRDWEAAIQDLETGPNKPSYVAAKISVAAVTVKIEAKVEEA